MNQIMAIIDMKMCFSNTSCIQNILNKKKYLREVNFADHQNDISLENFNFLGTYLCSLPIISTVIET